MLISETFALDQAAASTLADQLVGNIRRAIATGVFRRGDRLPGLRQMAKLCGTSLAVPRAAIRKLEESGEIRGRPGSGCIVLGRNESVWRGRVLLVIVGSCVSYARDTFFHELAMRLTRVRYHADFVLVPKLRRGDRGYDFSELKRALKGGCDLVVANACDAAIPKFLRASSLPYVLEEANVFARPPGCVGMSVAFMGEALEGFARHCSEARVRRVLQVDFVGCAVDASAALAAQGIAVERLTVDPEYSSARLECFKKCAYAAVARRLAGNGGRLECVFFADDFLASGGILALSDAGLHAPHDLKIATFANVGLTPVYQLELARVEYDPRANAAKLARRIVAFLKNGKTVGVVPFVARYMRGKTV